MSQDTDLTTLTLTEARDGLRAKEFSSRELTQSFIDRVAASEKLNAYILTTPDGALEAADQSDARLGTDDARALEGLPIGVKDLFCTRGVRTTACSNILGDFTPTYESKVTENLWADGALMLGKLNND
ncbi:MAG TPA: Asp-tRNA(Asn)/Glu-tRNA(Gln) amidotransferase GatCAB subunit A, partial [Rhodobiaceae bacterium]|nr:Asp-tRNA(Asn)/Glu-tRNA(Gln) amidotransferase GatCAB subunit A [Rhodobiaceae bacterium]